MNSLSELNGYSQTALSFTDDRIAAVNFDRINPVNQNTTTAVGQAHNVLTGIEITEIVKPELMNVYYEIDVSSVAGASVSWPTTPSGCVVSTPSTGVYRMSGISTKAQWDIVKNPSIVIDAAWDQDFTYYPAIHYDPSKTKAWDVFVLVGIIANLSSEASISAKLTGLTTSAADIQAQAELTVNASHAKGLQAEFVASGGLLAVGDIAIRFVSTATMTTANNYIFGPSPALNAVSTIVPFAVKTAVSGATVEATATLTHPGTPRLRTSAVPVSSSATLTFAPKLQSIQRVANDGLASNSSYYFIADEIAPGAVYVYSKATLALVRTITNPNPYGDSTDNFGRYIVANETYLAVTADGENTSTVTNAGKVYIFNISTGALVGTCSNPSTTSNSFASGSQSVALTSSYVYVGSLNEDYSGVVDCGTVYVFSLTGTLTTTIRPPSPTTNGRFGSTLVSHSSGSYVLIKPNIGSEYVYSGSGSLAYTFSPTSPDDNTRSMNSSYICVHKTADSVDLYNVSDGSWARTVDTVRMSGIWSGVGRYDNAMTDIYILRHNTVYTITGGNIVWDHLDRPSGSNYDWEQYALSNTDVIFSNESGYSWIYKI